MKSVKPLIAIIMGLLLATGCADLKAAHAQIDDVKSQLSRVSADAAAKTLAPGLAAAAARAVNQSAAAARSTANQALAAAQVSQSCCDATNEEMDRMARRSGSN